jgi:hypothetical protein
LEERALRESWCFVAISWRVRMLWSSAEVYSQRMNYLNTVVSFRRCGHTWCLLLSPRFGGDGPIPGTVGSRVYGKPHMSHSFPVLRNCYSSSHANGVDAGARCLPRQEEG